MIPVMEDTRDYKTKRKGGRKGKGNGEGTKNAAGDVTT